MRKESFVLDVINDDAIDRKRLKASQLLGDDAFQLLRGCRLFGRSKTIETIPDVRADNFSARELVIFTMTPVVARPRRLRSDLGRQLTPFGFCSSSFQPR